MRKFYCVDTSTWHRSGNNDVAKRWFDLLSLDQLSICDQVRLEILYSARSAKDYVSLQSQLSCLHELATPPDAFARALEVQHQLALAGGLHHRSVTIADLIIAASAEIAGHIVLHYDEDFDRIAAVTGQTCEWIAERGSL